MNKLQIFDPPQSGLAIFTNDKINVIFLEFKKNQ